jgi:hypothetical protein
MAARRRLAGGSVVHSRRPRRLKRHGISVRQILCAKDFEPNSHGPQKFDRMHAEEEIESCQTTRNNYSAPRGKNGCEEGAKAEE